MADSTIRVRAFAPADAQRVAALVQEIHAFHAHALPGMFQPAGTAVLGAADIERRAAEPGQLWLVAVAGDVVVGYAHAEVQRTPASAYKRASALMHVHAMGVRSTHRSRGAGHALVAAVRAEAAVQGLDGVSLEVYAFNKAARDFYLREGFSPVRELLSAPLTTPAVGEAS